MTEFFPDGTPIDRWFYDTAVPPLSGLGRQYILTEHGVADDGRLHTREFQALIDRVSESGGGVIVAPEGTYRTGALYMKQGVDLYVAEGAKILGSDDPSDYPVCETRIEGESCLYFPALINAVGLDGFTLCGPGTIDGNGLRSWRSFWLRRSWNPDCTNKDEQRARLVFISGCSNVTIAGLRLHNSQFWTCHIYKSDRVRVLDCDFFSPKEPVPAPSTDAIDIDACRDVLVKSCVIHVNDDAIALKGGKGPWADTQPENGANERILVEDCTFGFCHGCLTCGSESIHSRNILIRRIKALSGYNLLWIKMRPDTPQLYEYITVEQVEGSVGNLITVKPWTQFFDLKGRTELPPSAARNVTLRDCVCKCGVCFNISAEPSQYELCGFAFERLKVEADTRGSEEGVKNVTLTDVIIKKTE